MITRISGWLRDKRLRLVALGVAATVLAVAGRAQLAQKERELVFRIEPGTASWYASLPHGVQEFNLQVTGNPTQHIHAWWWPAAKRDAPAVLYLHGSRWNLTGQLFRIEQLHQFGFSVLAIDYRGFGKSAGELPSEQAVYEDARIAWDRLSELQPDAARRFIYGHSLGGAIAIELARTLSRKSHAGGEPPARGLIVESSFTTLADVAAAMTNTRLPIRLLLSQKFDSVDKIADVGMPVLFVHGTSDRYVPARFSEELYAAAAEPKKLLLIEGGTHNNAMRAGSGEYRKALRDLFGLGRGGA